MDNERMIKAGAILWIGSIGIWGILCACWFFSPKHESIDSLIIPCLSLGFTGIAGFVLYIIGKIKSNKSSDPT